MSLLFTLMLQRSSLRRGKTRRPYHPICCPCLCVSQLISLTKSGIIFQLPFILVLLCFVCLFCRSPSRRPPLSFIYHCPALHYRCLKRAVAVQHVEMSVRQALKVHKIAITPVKYRLFRRCFMKMRIRTCLKHTDDKSSLSFN